MLPLMPFMAFISTAALALWALALLVPWFLGKVWPLASVREPPTLAGDGKVQRKTVGATAYPFWPCLRRQTGWVHVDVTITPDGAYRGHEIIDASPPALFDRAVARALAVTTYEATDASPLPDRFETLYRFEPPPPRPRPGQTSHVASQAKA
jgi:hypothetical protein